MVPLIALFAGGAYLIGSVSFARIVGRLRAPHVDLGRVEYPVAGGEEVWVYRGVSATSVSEKVGLRWGLLVVALDVAKGLVPTLAVRLMWPDEVFYLFVGFGLVVGHVWPVWYRFIGGRGQSVLVGSVIAIDVVALPVAIVFGVAAGLLVFTSAFLAREGFGLWIWVWPLAGSGVGPVFWFGVAISTLYLLAIRPDIEEERRLAALRGRPGRYRERLSQAATEFTGSEP